MPLLDLVLFGVSSCGLWGASLRWSGRLASDLAPRMLGAASLTAAIATSESLLLGIVGEGSSPFALAGASVLIWVVARFLIADPDHPVRDQLAEAWAGYGSIARAAVGSAIFLVLGNAVFQLWRPTIGIDGLTYHAAEPAIWVGDGHPGSLHQTLANFPTQAYPKTMEVLVGWTYSIGRTPLAAVPLTVGLSVLVAGSVIVGLRRLGVAPVIAVLAAVAGLLLPVNLREASGIFSDVPSLAWLTCSVALSIFAVDDAATIGLAAVAGGLAISTKPTTAPFVLAGLAYALWVNRDRLLAHRRALAVPVVLALGLGGVWYIADWHAYGSPLWPFTQFPSGRPLPTIWREYGARFITDPVASYRAAGSRVYLTYLAGGLVLMAAVPVVAVLSLVRAGRPARRTMLIGGAAVVLEALLWADSEFTGLAHGNVPVVITGLRYLISAPLAAAVVLALATRWKSIVRVPAIAALAAALVLNLWELRRPGFGSPLRPAVVTVIALLVVGAVAGLIAATVHWPTRAKALRWLAPAVTIGAAALIAVPASSYVSHYLGVAQSRGYADAPTLTFLNQQPGWVHGTAPIAAGSAAYATFAGPHFSHPLSYVANDESCPSIRAAASRGWLVLEPLRNPFMPALNYLGPLHCMRGIAPAARFAGGVRVYAPPRLLASKTR